jgi:nitrous oxide reductase accessory protein NosL
VKNKFILFLIIIVFLSIAIYFLIGAVWKTSEKPVIHYGSDKCDFCGMVIVDKRYSAAYYNIVKKSWEKFDDIGCMFAELIKDGENNVSNIYVADYNTGEHNKPYNHL